MALPGARIAIVRLRAALRPRRRRTAFVALLPLVALVLVPVSGVGASEAATATGVPWWALPVLVLSVVLAAAILATYVPASGPLHRLALGCSPCATVAALTVVAAVVARGSGPLDPALALASLALLAVGLGHRLGDSDSCGVPPLPRRSVRAEEGRPTRSGPA